MHLYLRNNRLTREIPGITLRDGCIPVIGNQVPTFTSAGVDSKNQPVHIEPAVWFKVLILDSITIDCLKRGIKWTSKDTNHRKVSSRDSADHECVVKRRPVKRQLSKTIYSEEEYYNYQSNMDGMFQKAVEVMTAYGDMKINTYEFNETLLQLLHCYVLPAIRLSVEDIPLVELAYESMEDLIDEKNKEIVVKNTDIQRQKSALEKLRKTFITELQTSVQQTPPYPSELRCVLLNDLKNDITNAWLDLETSQQLVELAKCSACLKKRPNVPNEHDETQVKTIVDGANMVDDTKPVDTYDTSINTADLNIELNTLKRMSCFEFENVDGEQCSEETFPKPRGRSPEVNDSCTDCSSDLEEKRKKRNDHHEQYLRLINARENLSNHKEKTKRNSNSITNVLRSSFRGLRRERCPANLLNPLHNIYIEHVKCLETKKEELLYVTHRKVLITSVKEALRSALAELRSGSDTFGIDVAKSGSQRATDVLRQSHIPVEWQTLDEQISNLVSNENCKIGQLHNDFIDRVILQCTTALSSYSVDLNKTEGSEESFAVINPLFCMSPNKKITYDPCQSPGSDSNSDFVVIDKSETSDGEDLNQVIQILKEEIHDHFEQMCSMIVTSTESCAEVNFKKIWICYESHFYEVTMTHLLKLYETAYHQTSKNFTGELYKLQAGDLDASDYWIDRLVENDYDSGTSTGGSAEDILALEDETEIKKPITDFVNDPDCRNSSELQGTELSKSFEVIAQPNIELGIESLQLEVDTHLKSRNELRLKAATMPGRMEHIRTDKMHQRKSTLKMKSKYLEVFDDAMTCLQDSITEPSPLLKLQQLTRCLQSISSEISTMREDVSVCSDSLIDVLVLIILNCDRDVLKHLFIQLYFLADLMAPFMDSGPHNYSLVQFHVAVQYLKDRILMLKLGKSM